MTLMMLIEVDPTRSAALHSALAEHQRALRDVHLITRICEPVAAPNAPHAPPRPSRFHMAAIDRPGLVHIITSAQPPPQRAVCACASLRCARAPFAPAEFLAKHGLDVVEMKCEQREAFVDGKPRRLFFMDGLIAGEAASAKAFADGLKAMQGAYVTPHCATAVHSLPCAHARRIPRVAAEHGVSLQLMPDEGPEPRM